MQSNKSIQEAIDKTLQSIDGINRVDVPPFFYTRLQAKLDQRMAMRQPFWMVLTKPTVSLVTLSLLVILNITMIANYIQSAKKAVGQQSTGIEKFAQEYELGAASVYNDKTTGK